MNFLRQSRSIFFITSSLSIWASVSYSDVLDDASNFTVRVRTSIEHSFAEDQAGTSNGAGFLVDIKKRYLVTNAHVSGRGNSTIEIAFKGYEFERAEAVYVDPILDLAILQIENTALPEEAISANLDCSDRYLNGLNVAAYGHPHGLYFSASRGIISQVRTYEATDWIQTDAAINPGNSGGALIDLETGDVVGVNAMGFDDTQGLNFAVPMGPVCSILDLLQKDKIPSPPELPLFFATNEELDTHLTVAGNIFGPLPKGVMPGDILETVNGTIVYSPNEILELFRAYRGTVELGMVRGEKRFKTTFWVAPMTPILDRPFIMMDGALIAQDVYPERWHRDGLFQVHSLASGSLSEQSDLNTYRLIMSVNGVKPSSIEHLYQLLRTGENLRIITRSWSDRDNFLHDYFHVNYNADDIVLYRK
ncbi:trypsin-like peptidase domain-containing protein [Paracoccaceae bacterium]|nr:trypsin-like peptidase domain-containing protein [Paracoccaceae bacterium]